MTFKTHVVDDKGQPVQNALVVANVETTGASFSRFTDGEGYADVAMLANSPLDAPVTFIVSKDGKVTNFQYLQVTKIDQEVIVKLLPFVDALG